jgi:hypothetical protein
MLNVSRFEKAQQLIETLIRQHVSSLLDSNTRSSGCALRFAQEPAPHLENL